MCETAITSHSEAAKACSLMLMQMLGRNLFRINVNWIPILQNRLRVRTAGICRQERPR